MRAWCEKKYSKVKIGMGLGFAISTKRDRRGAAVVFSRMLISFWSKSGTTELVAMMSERL